MTDRTPGSWAGGPGRYRFGDVFSRSFAVFGRRFPLFLAIIVIGMAPSVFAQLRTQYLTTPDSRFSGPGFWAFVIATALFQFLLQAWATLFSVRAMRDGRVEIGAVLRRMGRRLPPLIVTMLVQWLLLAACTNAIGLPGGIVWTLLRSIAKPAIPLVIGIPVALLAVIGLVMIVAMIPVCLYEDLGPIATIRRSVGLTKGSRWLIFASFLTLYLVTGLISIAWTGVCIAISGPTAVGYMIAPVSSLISTFSAIFNASVYHELRQAKEGSGTDRLAEVFT